MWRIHFCDARSGSGAIAHYRIAAGRTASLPERHYLTTRAAWLAAAFG